MIDSISPVSVQRSNAASFKGELPYSKTQSQEKQGMSAAQKTLLGLGALAATTAGILLAKKHFDVKKLKAFAESIPVPDPKSNIMQIEELNIKSILDTQKYYAGKLGTSDFDENFIMKFVSKSKLKEILSKCKAPKEYFPALDNMSEKGFMVIGSKGDSKVFGYVDPKNISLSGGNLEEAFKDGEIFIDTIIKNILK